MSTPRSQRIGIWVIAIVMAIGSVGMYFVAIIANNNDTAKTGDINKIYAEYNEKITAQARVLSERYYSTFSQFSSRVRSFEKTTAQSELKKEDLVTGSGKTIDETTAFAAYYIGWNPDGNIFDQSISEGALRSPLLVSNGLKGASLIEGWREGMIGMNIGGVRELTIPSEKAYGSAGSGSSVAPDTPLKFVIMAIELPEEVPIPKELQMGQ